MRKLLLPLLIAVLMPFYTQAQKNSGETVDSLVSDFMDQLQAQGFERMGYARHYCVGYNYIFKPGEKCDYNENYYQVYVFWEDSNASFVKKFDNCGPYTMVQMSASPFFDAFEDNMGTIPAEELFPFTYNKNVNGKEEMKVASSDHSCRRDMVIYLSGMTYEKKLDMYNLKKKDGDKVNIHYSENKNLTVTDWESRTAKFIWKVEKKGGFVREYPEDQPEESAKGE